MTGSALDEPGGSSSGGGRAGRSWGERVEGSSSSGGSVDGRLTGLMEEFRRRQRERPDMVVRPWWASGPPVGSGEAVEAAPGRTGRRSAVGFVVEYCPAGVESVEIAVRRDRVRLEGPAGVRQATLELAAGWELEGVDVGCPELLANHLLSMADRLLGEAA